MPNSKIISLKFNKIYIIQKMTIIKFVIVFLILSISNCVVINENSSSYNPEIDFYDKIELLNRFPVIEETADPFMCDFYHDNGIPVLAYIKDSFIHLINAKGETTILDSYKLDNPAFVRHIHINDYHLSFPFHI